MNGSGPEKCVPPDLLANLLRRAAPRTAGEWALLFRMYFRLAGDASTHAEWLLAAELTHLALSLERRGAAAEGVAQSPGKAS